MSNHNSPILRKSNNSGKKSSVKSREVIELEDILADLQDSPLKVVTPVKFSPSRVRCSPRSNSAQKRSSPSFKRNLEKDYTSPDKEVKRIDFKSSPSKKLPLSSIEPSNGNIVVSPRKLSKANSLSGHLFSDTKKQTKFVVNSEVIDIAKVLEDSDNECATPIKNSTSSKVNLSNGVSSHKLSVTKRNSNLEMKPLNSQKNENGSGDILKDVKTTTNIKKSSLETILSVRLEDSNLNKQKIKHSGNEMLETNDIAAMLENSDDEEEDLFKLGSKINRKCGHKVVGESVPSPTTDNQREVGSSRRKINWKLEKHRMGYDDEDIIIIKDYFHSPEASTKSSLKKSKSACNSPKPVSSSKHRKGTVDRNKSKLKNRESDDDITIIEDGNYERNEKSSKKTGISKKGSHAKKNNVAENTDSTNSSRKSKVRRSLLQEATYSIEDCSQSPLRLKLKRKASVAIASNCNESKDESDEEPLVKLRKPGTPATKQKDKTADKASDTKNDDSGCTPLIKERKTESLKRKAGIDTTVEDEEDSSSDEEPLIKIRRMKTEPNLETKTKEKSLRSRESIKLPKWRMMDEMDSITTLKSPLKSPKSPKFTRKFDSPEKPSINQTHEDPAKFDQLVAAVENKFVKVKNSVNKTNSPSLDIGNEDVFVKAHQKTPTNNGLSKSVSSPRNSATKIIDRVPSEINECNSRPTRNKSTTKASGKIEDGSPNDFSKKLSNKEKLIRSSSKDLPRSPSKSNGVIQKSTKQILNSPLKLNSVVCDEIPSEGIKNTKNTTEVTESRLDSARIQLMVSEVPKSLPCRDKEFNNIYSFLARKIEDFAGGCMYISGVPGTGKTATVHAVVKKLQDDVENGGLSPFDFVEINSLRLTEPRQAYTRILQSLTQNKLPSEQALRMLDKMFSGRGRKSTVLLVDELDYLCNRRQDVIYSILEWPMRQGSGVVVLTIANTMDLPERTLKGKVTSRMGLTRLTFQPYTHHQLQEIVMNRLIGNDSFHPDAVQLVARKVAAVSGDARRALDICRRATELVSPSKGESTVTIQHVEKVVSQISTGRRILAIKACSTMAQLALRALRDETLRTGIDESNVAHMYKHLHNICALEGVENPTVGEIQSICTNLGSMGLIIAEKGRPDLMRKLSLNVSSDDIHYALNC